MNGKGVYIWKNGEKYEGNFLDGQISISKMISKSESASQLTLTKKNSLSTMASSNSVILDN